MIYSVFASLWSSDCKRWLKSSISLRLVCSSVEYHKIQRRSVLLVTSLCISCSLRRIVLFLFEHLFNLLRGNFFKVHLKSGFKWNIRINLSHKIDPICIQQWLNLLLLQLRNLKICCIVFYQLDMQLKLSCEAKTNHHVLFDKDVFMLVVKKITQSVGSWSISNKPFRYLDVLFLFLFEVVPFLCNFYYLFGWGYFKMIFVDEQRILNCDVALWGSTYWYESVFLNLLFLFFISFVVDLKKGILTILIPQWFHSFIFVHISDRKAQFLCGYACHDLEPRQNIT